MKLGNAPEAINKLKRPAIRATGIHLDNRALNSSGPGDVVARDRFL